MLEQIANIISAIKEKYNDLFVSYCYFAEDDTYEIWYNSKILKHDKEFNAFLGEIIYQYLYKNGLYNFYIDYNETKSQEIAFWDWKSYSFSYKQSAISTSNFYNKAIQYSYSKKSNLTYNKTDNSNGIHPLAS